MATQLTILTPGGSPTSWFTPTQSTFVVMCSAGEIGVEMRITAAPANVARVGDLVDGRVTPIIVEAGTYAPFGVDIQPGAEYRLVPEGVQPEVAAGVAWET